MVFTKLNTVIPCDPARSPHPTETVNVHPKAHMKMTSVTTWGRPAGDDPEDAHEQWMDKRRRNPTREQHTAKSKL